MKSKYFIVSIGATVIACILIVFFSKFLYKPGILANKGNNKIIYEKAKVLKVNDEKLTQDSVAKSLEIGYQDIDIEILTGEYANKKFSIKNYMSRVYNVNSKEGMEVIAAIYLTNDTISDVTLYSYKRDGVIYFLAAVFFIVMLLIGKMKGLTSTVALIFTGVMIVFFMIPMMFRGVNPIIASILTAIIIVIVTHLLITGINKKSFSAMLGTIAGVIISGGISYLAGKAAHLSGMTMDNIENLITLAESSSFKLDGLMFAVILIASLGAVMDIGMSIASSIFEIHNLNPELSLKKLFSSGMNVGKDVIGTMSNTLILAFVGGSLSVIILIMASSMQFRQVINLDILSMEIIQGVSGSIGIVLTVPITALISIALIKKTK